MEKIDLERLREVAINAQATERHNKLIAHNASVTRIEGLAKEITDKIIDNLPRILAAGASKGETQICIFDYGFSMEPKNDIQKIIMYDVDSSLSHPDTNESVSTGHLVAALLIERLSKKGYQLKR